MKIEAKNVATLITAQHAFEQWRSERNKGERIPEKLWALAVELARKHRPSVVAKTLRLDANHLKKRIGNHQPQKASNIEVVKLAPIQLGDAIASGRARPRSSELIAEITTSTGVHARIFSGIDATDVKALSLLLQEV
ncbi:MAG: hypothetical protein ACOH5I_22615 [Oligoflexus sp.]